MVRHPLSQKYRRMWLKQAKTKGFAFEHYSDLLYYLKGNMVDIRYRGKKPFTFNISRRYLDSQVNYFIFLCDTEKAPFYVVPAEKVKQIAQFNPTVKFKDLALIRISPSEHVLYAYPEGNPIDIRRYLGWIALQRVKPLRISPARNRSQLSSIEPKTVPRKVNAKVVRFIRDTRQSRALKETYGDRCQICNEKLETAQRSYSEVHHVKPLGLKGYDYIDNMLVLCPNHHALFDFGAIGIDPQDGITVINWRGRKLNHTLRMRKGHNLKPSNLIFHRKRMMKAKG